MGERLRLRNDGRERMQPRAVRVEHDHAIREVNDALLLRERAALLDDAAELGGDRVERAVGAETLQPRQVLGLTRDFEQAAGDGLLDGVGRLREEQAAVVVVAVERAFVRLEERDVLRRVKPGPIRLIDAAHARGFAVLALADEDRIAEAAAQLGMGAVVLGNFSARLPRQRDIIRPDDFAEGQLDGRRVVHGAVFHALGMHAVNHGLIARAAPLAPRLAVTCLDLRRAGILAADLHPQIAAALPAREQRPAKLRIEREERLHARVVVDVDRAHAARGRADEHAEIVAGVQVRDIARVAHVLDGLLLPATELRRFRAARHPHHHDLIAEQSLDALHRRLVDSITQVEPSEWLVPFNRVLSMTAGRSARGGRFLFRPVPPVVALLSLAVDLARALRLLQPVAQAAQAVAEVADQFRQIRPRVAELRAKFRQREVAEQFGPRQPRDAGEPHERDFQIRLRLVAAIGVAERQNLAQQLSRDVEVRLLLLAIAVDLAGEVGRVTRFDVALALADPAVSFGCRAHRAARTLRRCWRVTWADKRRLVRR